MAFGRRKQRTSEDVTAEFDHGADEELLAEVGEPAAPQRLRPEGPWDIADAPPLAEGHGRLDLGALQVAVPEGLEVRLDMNESGEVAAVTLLHAESTGQVLVFAAPRTSGIWDEVRGEIAEALTQGPGSAREQDGQFGTELWATVPAEAEGQGVALAPARFIGVDGPRWFARLLLTGPAAVDEQAAAPLLAAFRSVVVVRGDEAMPAREPLALSLPPEARQVEAPEPAPEEGSATLQMPARGPEISEVR